MFRSILTHKIFQPQACNELIGLKARRKESEKVPMLEEKCIRAIIGGSLRMYEEATSTKNEYLVDSSKRTLLRVRDLLDKMQETMKSEAWLYEVSAHLNSVMGWKADVLADLMKEYRLMQSENWEQDPVRVAKMVDLIKDIFQCHRENGSKESLSKCKLLINGVKKKVIGSSDYSSEPPEELAVLESFISELDDCIAEMKSK